MVVLEAVVTERTPVAEEAETEVAVVVGAGADEDVLSKKSGSC